MKFNSQHSASLGTHCTPRERKKPSDKLELISRKGKYKQTSKFANKKQNYKNILIPIKPIKVHVKPWTQVSNDLS